jgi:hypothetical protein
MKTAANVPPGGLQLLHVLNPYMALAAMELNAEGTETAS